MMMRDETKKIVGIQKTFAELKSELLGIGSEKLHTKKELVKNKNTSKQYYFFLSYSRNDDYDGKITRIKNILDYELKVIAGKQYSIFQDIKNIGWGENWEKIINDQLSIVPFLIPFVSPSFFNSKNCCDEIIRFIKIEKSRKRDDLLLPVYYVSIDDIESDIEIKELIDEIMKHNYIDLRNIRKIDEASIEYRNLIISLAEQAKKAINRI
jgi:hypothetical protein